MAAIYDNLTLNVRFNSPAVTTTTVAKSEEINDSLRSIREMPLRARSLERPIIRERRVVSLEPVVVQPPPVTPIYNCYYYRPPAQYYQKTRTSTYHTFNASPYTGYYYSHCPWYNYSHYYPYSGLSAEAMGALSQLSRINSFRYNSDVFPVHSAWPYNDYYPSRSYFYRHLY